MQMPCPIVHAPAPKEGIAEEEFQVAAIDINDHSLGRLSVDNLLQSSKATRNKW